MSLRYRTIVADPPWPYGEFVSYPGSGSDQRRTSKPLPYEPMPVPVICALPIDGIAADDCVLWLWTTSAYLRDGFDVLAAWGFVYKQTLVWHKTTARPVLGGSVAPNHAEFLLVGKRGSPAMGRTPSSVISAPGNSGRAPKHSRKPEAFLDIVEQVSPGPYVELFARRARFGWDYYGDESLGTAVMPSQDAA